MLALKTKVILITNIIILIGLVYFTGLYMQDRAYLKEYLQKLKSENVFSGENDNFMKAVNIRNAVIKGININRKTCRYFDLSKRPLWGYRISDIIKYMEGQCGEGTRLLLNIFHILNIPARRVYLFGYKNMHAVVEIYERDRWILIDTINSPQGFKKYTTEHKASVQDHFKLDLMNRTAPKKGINSFGFQNFSYFNWNKFFNDTFLKTEVYMHSPLFNKWQIWLENPPLIVVSAMLIALIIINTIYIYSKYRKKVRITDLISK